MVSGNAPVPAGDAGRLGAGGGAGSECAGRDMRTGAPPLIAGEHAERISGLIVTSAAHIDAGRLSDAETLLRQVLALDAHHADGLHLLGLVAHQAGPNDAA